jgi:signal transduction histidine kinase
MGLGLMVVKNVVDQAKGSICFNSVENEGTTFIVSFPLKK